MYKSVLLLAFSAFLWACKPSTKTFYVSADASLEQDAATIETPASLSHVHKLVRQWRLSHPGQSIEVVIDGGRYVLTDGLSFDPQDGGHQNVSVTYRNAPGKEVIISGGVKLSGEWEPHQLYFEKTNAASLEKRIWSLDLRQEPIPYFKQLFREGKRIARSLSPTYLTAGPLERYASQVHQYDFAGAARMREEAIDAFCSFRYEDHDLDGVDFSRGAQILIYHSWECSWHTIHSIDKTNKTVLLKTPGRYPIGFFGTRMRYRIENTLDAIDDFGEWCIDTVEKRLYYMAYPDENPNETEFIAARLASLLSIKGTGDTPVRNLHFAGITFAHSDYPLGINSLSDTLQQALPARYPWLDFSTGFTSAQGAPDCGKAVEVCRAEGVSFTDCGFTHLGAYALHLNEYTRETQVNGCVFEDLGGGGILVGMPISLPLKEGIPFEASPSNNQIRDCRISNLGLIHPSSIGVMVMQAHHTTVVHNEIYNAPYTGISVGWTWGDGKNYTCNNRIAHNHIHNILKELDDGGGIYTLGRQPGTVLEGNLIHDIYRPKGAIGAFNNGIFFDEGSAELTIRENVIYNIENDWIRFNHADTASFSWVHNYFGMAPQLPQFPREITLRAGPSR